MELFPGTFSQQVQSIKNSQLTKSVTTIRLRNIYLISIDYGFRPRLRGRLTLPGLTLDRNPWIFGDKVFHFIYRYLCQHSHFWYLQNLSRVFLYRLTERSATACKTKSFTNPQIRYVILAPLHLRRRNSIRPVSCYAIFKGWLLLSQPPGC